MDLLHTSKKFGICSGHIEEHFEPVNEKCHFPEGVKPKTTCIFVAIFSCCIECYDAAFLKKLICIVQCLLFPKIFIFWPKLKISSAKPSDNFFKKVKVEFFEILWGSLHKGLKLVYFITEDFISVQEAFKIFIRKRWKSSC